MLKLSLYCLLAIGLLLQSMPRYTCAQPCTASHLIGDIIVVLDESGSVLTSDFQTALEWTNDVLGSFSNEIDDGEIRVGILTFASFIYTRINLSQYSYSELSNDILSINRNSGGTYTGEAIGEAVGEFDARGRSTAAQILILMTDGNPTDSDDVLPAAEAARNRGITTISVGVGLSIDHESLEEVAGNTSRVFYVDNFDHLNSIVTGMRDIITETICQNAAIEPEVTCLKYEMVIKVPSAYYAQRQVQLQDLHLTDHSCRGQVDPTSSDFWIFTITPLHSCSTKLTSNRTHHTYINTLSNTLENNDVYAGSGQFRRFSCSYEKTIDDVSLYRIEYNVVQNVVNLTAPAGLGQFVATMNHFTDATYTTFETQTEFQTTATLYVRIVLDTREAVLNIVIDSCWVTPTTNITGGRRYTFIENGCPVQSGSAARLQITRNGQGHVGHFNSQVFAFVNYPTTYIHCTLQICSSAGGASCIPTCSSRKRRASSDESEAGEIATTAESPNTNTLSMGPFYEDEDEEETSSTILIVVAVGVALVSIAALACAAAFWVHRNRNLQPSKGDPVSFVNVAMS